MPFLFTHLIMEDPRSHLLLYDHKERYNFGEEVMKCEIVLWQIENLFSKLLVALLTQQIFFQESKYQRIRMKQLVNTWIWLPGSQCHSGLKKKYPLPYFRNLHTFRESFHSLMW